MGLKYFNKGDYSKVSEALSDIKKELESLQPVDSDTIQHSQSSEGVMSHTVTQTPVGGGFNRDVDDDSPSTAVEYYQFSVVDTSSVSDDGDVTLQVTVVNGHDSALTSAGVINGICYDRTDLILPTSGTYYIYAIDRDIYALNHTYASDLFPVVLLATVKVAAGRLEITQESFADNIIVPVAAKTVGSTTLEYEIAVSDYVLDVVYYVTARAYVNSDEVALEKTVIPSDEAGELYVYIEETILPIEEKATGGFIFGNHETAKFSRKVLGYALNQHKFVVSERVDGIYYHTYAIVFFNADNALGV